MPWKEVLDAVGRSVVVPWGLGYSARAAEGEATPTKLEAEPKVCSVSSGRGVLPVKKRHSAIRQETCNSFKSPAAECAVRQKYSNALFGSRLHNLIAGLAGDTLGQTRVFRFLEPVEDSLSQARCPKSRTFKKHHSATREQARPKKPSEAPYEGKHCQPFIQS